MISTVSPLKEVMHEAEMPGDVVEPTALLDALAAVENPIVAMSDHDQANSLFAALNNEFGFIRHIRHTKITGKPLDPPEQSRWASLVRWILRELKVWQRAEDPANRKLVAIFVVAQASDWENELWGLMPIEIGENADLIQSLKNLISSFAIVFTSSDVVAEPIWEREAVEKFKVADAEGDWVEIGNMLRAFEHQILPNILQVQSVQCLHRCGMDYLVDALANLHQTVVAMQVAIILPVDQRLHLAATSNNPHIQFGCIYLTLSGRQTARPLTPEEQNILVALLVKVAEDEPQWLAWMRVFNPYPMRYPALQMPLGDALSDVSDTAIIAYVNTIILYPKPAKPDTDRQSTAECLRAFRAKATPDRRALLWRLAHERWSVWCFDQANPDQHLFAINWSDLDYAVVAFACECMSDADRIKAMNTVRDELQALDDQWHTSVTNIVDACNRLLSRFQPYAHASQAILSGEDWLPDAKTYLPFDPLIDKYLAMKYRMS